MTARPQLVLLLLKKRKGTEFLANKRCQIQSHWLKSLTLHAFHGIYRDFQDTIRTEFYPHSNYHTAGSRFPTWQTTINSDSYLFMRKPLLSHDWILFYSFLFQQVVTFYIQACREDDSLILEAYGNKLLTVTSGYTPALLCASLMAQVELFSMGPLPYATTKPSTGGHHSSPHHRRRSGAHLEPERVGTHCSCSESRRDSRGTRHMATRIGPHAKIPCKNRYRTCEGN